MTYADRSWDYLSFPDSYGVRGFDRHDCASEFPWKPHWEADKLVTGTPLLLACVRGNSDVIQYLLDAGADADARGRCAEDDWRT